jgi:hypothetical protein
MERIRAALFGCLLAGGVLFGARPVVPERRFVKPVVYAAGTGSAADRSPAEFARWFHPIPPNATLASLIPSTRQTPPALVRRRRCNAARLRRRPALTSSRSARLPLPDLTGEGVGG